MNKRLLIILSLVVLALVIAGAILIWVKAPATPAPTSVGQPLSGFPVPPATINPPPAPIATPSTTTSTISISQPPTASSGPLIKLSPTPVAGAFLLPRVSSTTPSAIVYIEESTGYLFRVAPDRQNNQQLTNSSLPGVARAWWGIYNNVLTLLTQHLGNQEMPITLRLGPYYIKATTTETTELGRVTIPNVSVGAIAISPDGDQFFALTNTDTGVAGTIYDIARGKIKTIFTSHLKSWAVAWPAPTIITLTPRAAAGIPGTVYFLNPNTGGLNRILGGQSGLTVLANQTGTKILYDQELGDLKVYSVRDGGTRALTIATLPEKCVWASNKITIYCAVPNMPVAGQYPDDWWSGEAAFNDNLWRVNTDTGEAKVIWSGGAGGVDNQFDGINLILDEANQYLIFTDRWTAILWSLDLRP